MNLYIDHEIIYSKTQKEEQCDEKIQLPCVQKLYVFDWVWFFTCMSEWAKARKNQFPIPWALQPKKMHSKNDFGLPFKVPHKSSSRWCRHVSLAFSKAAQWFLQNRDYETKTVRIYLREWGFFFSFFSCFGIALYSQMCILLGPDFCSFLTITASTELSTSVCSNF